MQRVAICRGVDRDRLHAKFATGRDDSQGNLAAIGDENLFKHLGAALGGRNAEQRLAEFHALGILDQALGDHAFVLALDLVH